MTSQSASPVTAVQFETPAGRALLLMRRLLMLGHISKDEALIVENLIWHPDFPASLRLKPSD